MQRRTTTETPTQDTYSKKALHPFVMGMLLLVSATLVFTGFWWFPTVSRNTTAHAANAPAIGINLSNIGDTSPDFLFADMIKQGFRMQNAPGQSSTPSLDSNGWPQGDFTAFMWDAGFYPAQNKHTGTYTLRFNGKAHVSAQFAYGSVTPQNNDGTSGTYDSGTNTTTVTVIYAQPNTMGIEFTQTRRTASSATNTGITNIQMMRPTSPGSNTSYSFNTTFTDGVKSLLAKFQVIRFMNYSGTNGSTAVNWSDRQLPTGFVLNGRGAWEYAIQLCNETGRDAYINVPATANDNYVLQLARLFKYGSDANGTVYTSPQANPVHAPLNADRHVYIEYSNEVWNGVFAALEQNRSAAIAEVNAGNSPLNYDGETGTYQWGWRRVGLRIKQISDTFRSVFGDGAMPPNSNAQVRPILEWQYGNGQGTAEQPLKFLDNYYNNADGKQHVANPHPVKYFLWGGGGAGYTGMKNADAGSIDGIYASGFDDSVVNGTVKTDVQWTDAYGLQDIAYEGGFQIGGDFLNDTQKAANLDPRAKQYELQTQSLFTQSGGDLLVYFDSTSPNYGLAQPTIFDLNTPKLQAIDQINQGGTTPNPTPTPTSPPSSNLPSPWQTGDIGPVGQNGAASYNNGTFSVSGSGTDIWDNADSFRFVYRSLNGDGSIVARIASQQNTNDWAKTGVMMRETLNADAKHAFMALTPGNGAAFQRRPTTAGSSLSTSYGGVTAPYWVKLTRAGNTITGYISNDGTGWTQVGAENISLASTAYVGLAVSAHNNSTVNTSTFSLVSVTGSNGNLALGKTATASSSENSGTAAALAVDGNGGTRWSSLYSDPQWLQVDLGAAYSISQVKLSWENAYASSYKIQVSSNGSSWSDIYSTTNSSGGTQTLTGLSGSGRYIRVYCTQRATPWGYSLWEFEVYGS